jgi:hypothetical protein
VTIAIGIETKTRPNRSYLAQTFDNLERAGVRTSPYLAYDGLLPAVTVSYGDTRTRHQNARNAIRNAVCQAKETGAEWVMKLEDDLDFTDDFLGNVGRWLEDYGNQPYLMFTFAATFEQVSQSRWQDGETNIFQPGTSFPTVRGALANGKTAMQGWLHGFWGALCLVWRTEVAEQLVEWMGEDPCYVDAQGIAHRDRGHDLLLQTFAEHMGARRFLASCPSFVQHIGRDSNLSRTDLGHTQPFVEFPFAGRDYRYMGAR